MSFCTDERLRLALAALPSVPLADLLLEFQTFRAALVGLPEGWQRLVSPKSLKFCCGSWEGGPN